MSGARLRPWPVVVAVLLSAALLGLLPVLLTPQGSLALVTIGLAALSAIVLRARLSSLARARGAEQVEVAIPKPASVGEARLKWSRIAFFIGVATLTESTWRPVFGITVSHLFFLLALAGCLFAGLRNRRIAIVPGALVLGTVVFAMGGALSSFGATDAQASFLEAAQGVYVMLIWAWTGAMVLRHRSDLMIAIALWGLSAALNGLGAVIQIAGIESLVGDLVLDRATGYTPHPNDLGSAAAVALVPALFFALQGRSRHGRVLQALRFAVPLLVAAGVALSASVSGFLAATVAVLIFLSAPFVPSSARVAVVLGLSLPIVAIAIAGGDLPNPLERVADVTDPAPISGTAGSGEARLDAVTVAIEEIEADPIVGTGLDPAGGAVDVISNGQPIVQQIHVTPVAVWYQAGILGILGLVTVIGASIVACWRALASASEEEMLVGWTLLAAYAAFLVLMFSIPLAFQQYVWFAGVMLVAWSMRRDADAVRLPAGERREAFPTALTAG